MLVERDDPKKSELRRSDTVVYVAPTELDRFGTRFYQYFAPTELATFLLFLMNLRALRILAIKIPDEARREIGILIHEQHAVGKFCEIDQHVDAALFRISFERVKNGKPDRVRQRRQTFPIRDARIFLFALDLCLQSFYLVASRRQLCWS